MSRKDGKCIHEDYAIRAEKKIEKLQEQNKILKEALEFYADGDNYGHISPEVATYSVIDNCDLGVGDFMLNETVDDERVGGKRAREALAKVEE